MSATFLPKRGRPGALFLMSVERHLTRQDLVQMAAKSSEKSAPPMIQRLKSRHHEAARLVAQGLTYREIASRTEYTAQRISDMATKDPAFMNLVSYYSDQTNELGIDDAQRIRGRLLDVSESALIELQERMESDDSRKKMSVEELRKLTEMGTDRTVAPPRTAIPGQTVPARITFNIGTRDLRPKSENEETEAEFVEIENENPED